MPADGQSLVYDEGYQKWINTTVAGGSGGSVASGGFNSSAVVDVKQVIKTEPWISTTSGVPVDVPEMPKDHGYPKVKDGLNSELNATFICQPVDGLLTHF